ncbi:hypothetical protein M8C21_027078 [Ambrosia artemisiifolia]|uniref:Kinesin motor domain-containing protein n=1 Tax=Ambrosia artemisiifolia TaxID=4212 RepID=A0AAD5GJE4_AMBAR|nr:hypothetical protein M8C21_027078 [Ambrosia artemisiifolia]
MNTKSVTFISSLFKMVKTVSKNTQTEANENQFDKTVPVPVSVDVSVSRTPLDTIPDPSQFSKEFLHEVLNQNGIKDKLLDVGCSGSSRRKFDSANSTPARSVVRSNVGQFGVFTGPRVVQSTGDRGGGISRVSRRISSGNCELVATEVPCFELEKDPLFWDDHNVQVLIRMRPLSNMEKMTQGYSRCLKQESLKTVVWLGNPEVKFTFDHIVSETISQEKLFSVAGLPMIDNCMSGYNSCMFAYGQTGSGKTYTMMGEISQRDGKFVDDCGMTPRLFEYLFTRIKSEEESRRDERLKYSCKCSFLEIYNEQITDLLEPSSTNLQLREGLKEGVYVENLTEYTVETVDEVIKLLLQLDGCMFIDYQIVLPPQGAANRKVAGTDMNSESSRSHSVFTCIIESRWEKDSVTHLRFARLNLVDLAGSERQRSFGAGERLKEASYINKSLSTLGLVIMSLVDVTHGKHRHVPYRDSRLTFLLQDSLGGNSKTTIIANVSPSIAAYETLSTLKFAQRAKLIQNNAKVNEDASGDVTALQRQIQMLKEQMFSLMKQQKISKPVFQVGQTFQPIFGELCKSEDSSGKNIYDDGNVSSDPKVKVETVSSSIDLGDEMRACNQVEDKVLLDNSGLERTNMLHANLLEELMDARTLIDTMKSQQARLIEELQYVRQENDRLVEALTNNNKPHIQPILNQETHISENILENQNTDQSMMDLQARLDKMNKELEDLKLLDDPLKEQESASTRKDIKDEAEKLQDMISQVQHELKMKTDQLDDLLVRYDKLESRLTDTEAALAASKSCLQHSEETVDALSYQNAELRSLLEDLYHKTSETEKQLEEHKEMVKTLENEIHCTTSSTQEHFLFSLEGITDDLKRVSVERDQLCEQVNSLQDKLEMAYAIADEKEAIAVEARQVPATNIHLESQASKIYAEQKEEEVKILESSVEELDSTINMLEKRVNEMEEELERHHRIRDSLEVELQSLSQRLLTFECFRNGNDIDTIIGQPEDQISRKLHSRYLELQEAHARIKDLEEERIEQANEIKQCKEYISELVIHAEAQASQYQQKYKSLEAMVRVMQMDSSKSVSGAPLTDKTEKSSVRARGSGSPFRCIGNLVQQMNTEKDQELSLAKLHLEELEALASNRQKEICMLNTKLAAAESMTHDVIRDLLGVKLDMTNYANLINQNHLQRFIEDAAQQTQEFIAMEQEIRKLKRQINDLLEERDRCISELHSKEADILASKMTVMQLQSRDQLLTAQNEMLKADKTNLQRRAAELDDMIKKLLGTHPTESSSQQHENHMSKASSSSDFGIGKRLANSERLLLRVNNELAQYRKPDSSRLHHKMDEKSFILAAATAVNYYSRMKAGCCYLIQDRVL